jgi:hypothetical protein
VQAASGALCKLLAKGFRAGCPCFAIEIKDDTTLGIAMLIAEMGDGCYQPIVARQGSTRGATLPAASSLWVFASLVFMLLLLARPFIAPSATDDLAASDEAVRITHTMATPRSAHPPRLVLRSRLHNAAHRPPCARKSGP